MIAVIKKEKFNQKKHYGKKLTKRNKRKKVKGNTDCRRQSVQQKRAEDKEEILWEG
jgi:hypothetical protein